MFIKENEDASVKKCGRPYTEHCVWAEGMCVGSFVVACVHARNTHCRYIVG